MLKISYPEAYRTVKILNVIFSQPLISTKRGGFGCGGAKLTSLGKEILERYRAAETAALLAVQEHATALQRLSRASPAKNLKTT